MEGDDQLRERFECVFHEHHAAVCAYAFRRADRATAQDAVSETFLIAWRRCGDLPAEPLPWLFSTARRVLANQRRAAGHQRSIERRLAREPVMQPFEPGDSVTSASACRAALERLGEGDRETLMLLAWEELDRDAAARAIGCSRATFAVRLHRARRRFKAELAADGFDATTIDAEPA